MDITGGLIYYLYLLHDSSRVIEYDSEGDTACAIISTLIVMSHKDSSQMTK